MSEANPLIAWSGIKDSAGALVSQYSLKLTTRIMNPTSVAFGFFTELFYMGFIIMATVSAELLKAIADPNRWTGPLERVFASVTNPIYSVIPPMYIAVAAMGIMLVLLLLPKTSTMSARFGAEEFQRIGVGVAIVMLVVMWMMNPFVLLGKVLNGIITVANDLIPGAARGSQLDTLSADTLIRPGTILVNYRTKMSDECVTAWSHLQDGSDLTSFNSLNCEPNNASVPNAITLALSAVMCLVALMFFVFAVMAAWKFFTHIILCGLVTFVLVYVFGASILKRRALDFPARVAASGIGHFVIALLVMFLTVLFPLLAVGIVNEFDTNVPLIVQMFCVALGYLAGAVSVWFASRRHGRLVELLRADITSTLNNYLGVPSSVTERLDVQRLNINQHLASLRNQLASWTDSLREGVAMPGFPTPGSVHNAEGKAVASVLPDTPQSALGATITAGNLTTPKVPLSTVVLSSGSAKDPLTMISMSGGSSGVQDTAGRDGKPLGLDAPGADGKAFAPPTAPLIPWKIPGLSASVTPGAGSPADVPTITPSLPGASLPSVAGSAPPPVPGASAPTAPVVDPAQEALRRFREGRSLLSTAQGSFMRPDTTEDADHSSGSLISVSNSPLPRSAMSRASAEPVSGRSLIRSGAATGVLPSITAYGDMMSTMNGVSRLAKARGQSVAINLPDDDPAFGVRFNDVGDRVSPALDFGFGDVI